MEETKVSLNKRLVKKLAEVKGEEINYKFCNLNSTSDVDTYYLYEFNDFTLVELSDIIHLLKRMFFIKRIPHAPSLQFDKMINKRPSACPAAAVVETYEKGQNSNLYQIIGDVLYVTMSPDVHNAFCKAIRI